MAANKIQGGRAGSIEGGTPVSALPAMPAAEVIQVPPPIPITLNNPVTVVASGLAGAIGCDYIPTTNQLAFVEYGGNVSILNLIRPQVAIVSQGSATLH